MESNHTDDTTVVNIQSSKFKLRPRVSIIIIALVALVGGYFLIKSFASSIYPTGANDIVLEKTTEMNQVYHKADKTIYSPLDAVVYGNGTLVCGNDSPNKSAGSTTTLTSDQMSSLIDQVLKTGFKQLPTQIVNPNSGKTRLGSYTSISLNLTTGTQSVSYFGGVKPTAFTEVEKLIKKQCQSANSPVDPAKLNNVKLPQISFVKKPSALQRAETYLRNSFSPKAFALWLSTGDESNQLTSVNAQRAAVGLNQLPQSACLTMIASNWAQHMSSVNTLEHDTAANGGSFFADPSIVNTCSGIGSSWTTIGENVGVTSGCENVYGGDSCSQGIFNAFMNSCGHKANILSETFNLGANDTCTSIGAVNSQPWDVIGMGAYRDTIGKLWIVQDYVECNNHNCGSWPPATNSPAKLTVLTTLPAGATTTVNVVSGHTIGFCGFSFIAPQTCSSGPNTTTNNSASGGGNVDGSVYHNLGASGSNITASSTVTYNGVTYTFTGWTVNQGGTGGVCSGNVCGIAIAPGASTTITANYQGGSSSPTAKLNVAVNGYPNNLTITTLGHTAGDCGSSFYAPTTNPCQSSPGGTIGASTTDPTILVAPTISGYTFNGWSGCNDGTSGNNCSVYITAGNSDTVVAAYTASSVQGGKAFSLNVAVAGPHSASIALNSGTLGSCTASFTAPINCTTTATSIGPGTITAPSVVTDNSVVPAITYVFSSWTFTSGSGVSCTGATCTVSITKGQGVTANYNLAPASNLNVNVSGYSGTVTFNSYQHSVANCDSTIPGNFTVSSSNNYGSRTCTSGLGYGIGTPDGLYISPIVPSGYKFSGWTFSGSGGASSSCTNTSNTALTSSMQCVNVPANGASATITATFTVNQPATLTMNVTGLSSYSVVSFSSTQHDIGYCYGYTSAWSWPGSNVCSSGTDSSGNYYPIGPTYLNAPAQVKDTNGLTYNFTGWGGYCAGTGSCYVNIAQGQGASLTANYQLANATTLYIYLSGSPGTVGFTSSNHTLGNCNPSFQTFYVGAGSYIACTSGSGYGIGWPDGATVNAPSSVYANGVNYTFTGWGGSSWSGTACNSYASYYNRCVNMAPGSPYYSITANYSYVPPTCYAYGAYPAELCINVNNYYGWSYSTNHSVGTCVSATYTWFQLPAYCNGFQFGPPDGLYLYFDSAVSDTLGVTHYLSTVNLTKPPATNYLYYSPTTCYSTYCYVNYGNSTYDTASITAYYY